VFWILMVAEAIGSPALLLSLPLMLASRIWAFVKIT
jgi:hypothetical protein